ncbi:MAG: endopeptidase La [Ignavibacteria bacterium]|nr:endopeptidase La [Ignavibacteria bacterium]
MSKNDLDAVLQEQSIVDDIPEVLPVLPLRDIVLFPYMMYPVLIGREQSINAANQAIQTKKYIFLAAQKKSNIDNPKKADIYAEGTVAKIVQILKMPNGLMKILVDGLVQGQIKKFTDNRDYFEAHIDIIVPVIVNDHEMNALVRQMTTLFKEYVKINKNVAQEALNSFESIEEPDRRLYYAAANIMQTLDVKQALLQKATLKEQYFEIIRVLNSEIDILKIEKEIDSKVQENIAKSQRRFIIQEQIKILQNELGDDDEISPDIQKIADKIKKAKMPKMAHDKAIEELNKLKKIPSLSPEFTVVKNYLDWMLAVPWQKKSVDNLDIDHVYKTLNEDHYGLEKPKERIIEHIAVLNLVKEMRGQILCFVGPPGVGKTSLGRSIARALGREFVRISLGGVRDEAEIRGHRRTYIGSLPGKIVQAMKRAGTVNPVILLDEIDKLSSDFRGDPSSAMLEVLDPEQNHTFQDHYLEVDYDLSKVMFITTANVRYSIPLPLQDRMEIIELTSYLELDKIEIAKRHIIPKQLGMNGLADKKVIVEDEAIRKVVREYTREAGVRNLEREIASLFRKTAKAIVVSSKGKKNAKTAKEFLVTPEKIEELLGIPKFKSHRFVKENRIGSALGLAWTSVGGELLPVDVSVMPGPERLLLTGQLGDVMKESAMAALSYIRSNAAHFGLKANFYKGKEIHIHLPEGAIPKDGPSAGITLTMALLSAFKQQPASGNIAMTGEITLRGNVLAIGGLTEKLLAAKRNNVEYVLIPQENEVDLKDIPEKIKESLTIIPVENIDDAMPHVFVPIRKTAVKKTVKRKK